ncbi:MAG: TIGR02281 family clan AA aspartic protease [Pontixanthobacter sp.]
MDIAELWTAAADIIRQIPKSGLLIATLLALAIGAVGSLTARHDLPIGRYLRSLSTLMLVGILVTVVLQLARFDPRLDVALPDLGLPEQVVEGGETRVPLSSDGHFWLRAQVNSKPVDFMVDTGATLTAVSADTAKRIGLEARRGGIPVRINTANGTISASIASVDEIRFGNVAARGLDAVIAPNLGDTNVIGMNLLSRLKGWRVENNVLILTPNNPQPVAGATSGE